ncbi:GNAT family N-acetyltransferase [Rhizobium leguminosarum]|uniref:GNAT family N-acetyltransferase n=1 Tax=Rhizobium leguminosarum TaxID=384 RepID=UPI001C95A287|nr:GNAT family N-acetyltransferase [Rhizobium leguminosarum]MBY5817060.1 GNAT family N-acetyltransferase [Rhizobium leguminosarum]
MGIDSTLCCLVSGFSRYYPDIDDWFAAKVIPGMFNGTRRIIAKSDGESIHGLAILKKDLVEQKICTLWVHPSQRGFGLGQRLIDEATEWLGCKQPILSVPQEVNAHFNRLLTRNGFELRQRILNAYRPGTYEFVYNGELNKSDGFSVLQ